MNVITKGQAMVEDFLVDGINTWVNDGRLSADESAKLRKSLNVPEVEHALFHAGSHFAISLPLRFPFGAAARFFYTFALRVKAEAAWLAGGSRPTEARRLHTVLVMLFALLPGVGRLAYFLSPSLAGQPGLLVIPVDQIAQKVPLRLYERLHLEPFFLYWARSADEPRAPGFSISDRLRSVGERLAELRPHAQYGVPVLILEAAVFLVGANMYVNSDRESTWWFDERGVIATIDVTQLLLAAYLGIASYRLFWSQPREATLRERAGILLWGAGGLGLLAFAIDDFFTIHETVGTTVKAWLGFAAPATNSADDIVVLGYAIVGVCVLFCFRMELFAKQASSTLLLMAAAAAILMVASDAFAHALALKALELPIQTLADSLLLFAFATRYTEVRNAGLRSRQTSMVKARTT